MNVLIIGGSGLVGSNIKKLFDQNKAYVKVIATHLGFATDDTVFYNPEEPLPDYLANVKWNIIIHTGALTNVDLCEQEVDLSYRLTVESTKVLINLSDSNSAKLVYISTDYVFDGKNGPYFEDDVPNPVNIYGKHKLEAEQLVLAYKNSLIIRITNVYGEELRNKNFIARILKNIKDGEIPSVTAPSDQFATPINAYDIAKAINVLLLDNKIGIYHLSSTDYMTRVQLLQKLNKYFNNTIEINILTSLQLKQKAMRPLLGGLNASKFIKEYPKFEFSNIDDYILQNYA